MIRERYWVPIDALYRRYEGKQIPPVYEYHPMSRIVRVSWRVYRRVRSGE